MFSIATMSQKSSQFLLGLNSQGTSRNKETSIALAKAISNTLSVPTTPVEDIKDFYNNNYALSTMSVISKINEITILDVQTVDDYTRMFFALKYNLITNVNQTVALKKDSAIEDYFGISKSVPCDVLDVIKADPSILTIQTGGFSSVLEDIKALG